MNVWDWLLVLLLLSVVANGLVARAKSRWVFGWVFLGLMFNPIPLVILLFLPSLTIPMAHERADGSSG